MNAIDVKSRILTRRNQAVLLDRDVAAIYGVETKATYEYFAAIHLCHPR